ncbi:MAG: hypothetical protein U0401_03320 [Anaerolineae bacterium]
MAERCLLPAVRQQPMRAIIAAAGELSPAIAIATQALHPVEVLYKEKGIGNWCLHLITNYQSPLLILNLPTPLTRLPVEW